MNGATGSIEEPQDLSVLIRTVGTDRPWTWLAAGAADIRAAPGASLAWGAFWVVLSVVLTLALFALGLGHWLLPLIGGFMFVGPLVAVGTYAISRRLEQGKPARLADAFGAWRNNTMQLALMGVALMIFLLAWIRLATLLFALFFGVAAPDPQLLLIAVFTTPTGIGMLVTGTLIGAVLTFGAYAISAISLPMLLDRDVSVLEAIVASLRCVALNVRTMLLWAVLLSLFIAIGMLTFYVGLILILPLLGHASWHAYRDLVEVVNPD